MPLSWRPALTVDELERAFKTYFDEMEKCKRTECYWALLHIIVVLPDICAALEHPKGETTGVSGDCYKAWCERYWRSDAIAATKRWEIRCALLHQGRTVLKGGQTFSYVRPTAPGSKVHEYVHPDEPNTTVEVHELAAEVNAGIRRWFNDLTQPKHAERCANVKKHLPWLAREKPKTVPGVSSPLGNVSSTMFDTSSPPATGSSPDAGFRKS